MDREGILLISSGIHPPPPTPTKITMTNVRHVRVLGRRERLPVVQRLERRQLAYIHSASVMLMGLVKRRRAPRHGTAGSKKRKEHMRHTHTHTYAYIFILYTYLVGVLLHQVREAVEDLAALPARHLAPGFDTSFIRPGGSN